MAVARWAVRPQDITASREARVLLSAAIFRLLRDPAWCPSGDDATLRTDRSGSTAGTMAEAVSVVDRVLRHYRNSRADGAVGADGDRFKAVLTERDVSVLGAFIGASVVVVAVAATGARASSRCGCPPLPAGRTKDGVLDGAVGDPVEQGGPDNVRLLVHERRTALQLTGRPSGVPVHLLRAYGSSQDRPGPLVNTLDSMTAQLATAVRVTSGNGLQVEPWFVLLQVAAGRSARVAMTVRVSDSTGRGILGDTAYAEAARNLRRDLSAQRSAMPSGVLATETVVSTGRWSPSGSARPRDDPEACRSRRGYGAGMLPDPDDPRPMTERMRAGDRYFADDPEIDELQATALDLMAAYNATSPRQEPLRRQLLGELLGFVGEGTAIRPPLYVDYGRHLRIGARCFANFGLVALDVAPITIGDNVWLGGGAIVLPGVTIGDDTVVAPARSSPATCRPASSRSATPPGS